MTIQQHSDLVSAGWAVIQLVLPALTAVEPRRLFRFPWGWSRCIMVAVFFWLIAQLYRSSFDMALSQRYAQVRGHDDYDGVGMNVAVMMFGWIIPFTVALISWRASRWLETRAR